MIGGSKIISEVDSQKSEGKKHEQSTVTMNFETMPKEFTKSNEFVKKQMEIQATSEERTAKRIEAYR